MKIKKERAKRSVVWLLQEKEFIDLVKNSRTWTEVLKAFGLENKGGNSRTAKQRVSNLNLDTSHFLNRIESSLEKRRMTLERFREEWLTENSEKQRNHIKSYLVKFNLLEYKCFKCLCNGIWQEEPLSLQLEHINGISNDNRLDNLCFLCPNCHSQTSTFSGKSNKKCRG
jgi:hypothetical protein